jgi:hypothetical protein
VSTKFAKELRSALVALRERAHGDIFLPTADVIQAAIDGDARAASLVAQTLHDTLPALLTKYRLTAASIAADLYDLEREAVGAKGVFSALVPDVGDGGANELVGWATSKARTPDTLVELLQGGMDRRIWQASRSVYMTSSIADPAAHGWQRETDGNACAFCVMLAGRGTVYSEASADFSSHDHCGCTAVAAWDGQAKPVKPYEPSKRSISDADRKRVRDWIAANT